MIFELGHFIETHAVGIAVVQLPSMLLLIIIYHWLAGRWGKTPRALKDILTALGKLAIITEHLAKIEKHHAMSREEWAAFIEARNQWSTEPWRFCKLFEDCPAIRGQLQEIRGFGETLKMLNTSLAQLSQTLWLGARINGHKTSD